MMAAGSPRITVFRNCSQGSTCVVLATGEA